MTTCRHTPSLHRMLAARFLDHFLNGETPHAEDDRVLCAKCGAELSHPEAYLHPAVRIACLCSSTAAGLAALWMLQGLVQAQWSYLPSVILTLAAAVATALILERAVVSFVLAAFPWERIEAAPEDLCLHRTASAAERMSLKRRRRRHLLLNALQVCTVLLKGAEGSVNVMLFAAVLLVIELVTRRERPVLLVDAAALLIGLLAALLPLPAVARLLLNAAALTVIFGVISLVLEERSA